MDDEDLREAEESRTLNVSNEFGGFGTEHDPVRKTAAIDLLRPLEETVGSKLLKRLGWREGQGIGPRVRRAANLGDDDGQPVSEHLFAPEDVRILSYERKTDHKGLGYESNLSDAREAIATPLSGQEDASTRGGSPEADPFGQRSTTTRKTVQRGKKTGMGIGVLNDDGSDDEDPYSMGPRISYHRVIGGERKPKPSPKSAASSANPLLKTKPTFISRKLAGLKGVLRKCHDGRLPPEGFVLAERLGTMTLQDDKYRPPNVPAAWKSSVSKSKGTIANPGHASLSTAQAARASTMTARSRAAVLGEPQLPGKSVFDFLTPAARDKLVTVSGRQNLPAAGGEAPPGGFKSPAPLPVQSLIPQLAPEMALQALNRGATGWMPYAEDEKKRNRYRTYLEMQAGLRKTAGSDDLPPRAEGMSQDDWVTELHEFARAAEVFKPISGPMASRFTSSSSLPETRDGDSANASNESLLATPNAKAEDPAVSAAKMGMFGPLTRSVSTFSPTRLVCKRFSVPVPDHSASAGPGARTSDTFPGPEQMHVATQLFRSYTPGGFQTGSGEVVDAGGTRSDIQDHKSTDKRDQEEPVGPVAIEPDRNEALEQERPGQAVFRAIFGSDDEDD